MSVQWHYCWSCRRSRPEWDLAFLKGRGYLCNSCRRQGKYHGELPRGPTIPGGGSLDTVVGGSGAARAGASSSACFAPRHRYHSGDGP